MTFVVAVKGPIVLDLVSNALVMVVNLVMSLAVAVVPTVVDL